MEKKIDTKKTPVNKKTVSVKTVKTKTETEEKKSVEKSSKVKTVKEKKVYGIKKLPSLFKKNYSEKKFNKKILKKLYIPKDKSDVEAMFEKGKVEGKPELLSIKKDLLFTKNEIARFKVIAKDIKGQKGRFKLLPFVATACAMALIVIAVVTFKNIIVKNAIVSACEAAFEAKTDVGSVKVEILGGQLKVKNLAVGNKDSYYRNLFEIETIDLHYNLTQALRGKVVIYNIECTGMKFNTKRSTSCYIKPKEKKPQEESAFAKALKEKTNIALEDLKNQAAQLAGGDDVDSIVKNFTSQLQTVPASEKAKKTAVDLTDKWKKKPEELKVEIDSKKKEIENKIAVLNSIDTSKPEEILKAIAVIDSLLKEFDEKNVNGIRYKIEKTKKDVTDDFNQIKVVSTELNNAVIHDRDYVKYRVDSLIGTVANPKGFLTDALNTVGYDVMGQYYPYVQELTELALEIQRNAKAENEKKPKMEKPAENRTTATRRSGTTMWYSKEYPSVLIEKIEFSADDKNIGLQAKLTEVSSNPDIRNKPCKFDGKFRYHGYDHSASLIVDARTVPEYELVEAGYTGTGFKAHFDGTKIAEHNGVPSLDGSMKINIRGTAGPDGFTAGGGVNLKPVTLTSDGFENERITKYYNQALAAVDELNIDCLMGYKNSEGLIFNLDGNFAVQFEKGLKAAAYGVAGDVSAVVIARLNEKINSSNSEALAKLKEAAGIEGEVNVQTLRLTDIKTSLETKRKEFEKKQKEAAVNKLMEGSSQNKSGGVKVAPPSKTPSATGLKGFGF